MNLGVLTSVDLRHRHFVRRLSRVFPVTAVIYEQTGYSPATLSPENLEKPHLTEREAKIVQAHFAERSRQENIFFGHDCDWIAESERCRVRRLEPGELNSAETLQFLESAGVDTLAVLGTNLIKAPLLVRWPGRMVNLHLGLSPYYRGTATNFYPLVNGEPEFVGATIHLLNESIDGGPIFRHARPEIVADDQPHTIGCKAISAGIEAMVSVLTELDTVPIPPVPQWIVPRSRLYLRKDYHPRQVVELYRRLENGLIRDYVQRTKQGEREIRLVRETRQSSSSPEGMNANPAAT